MFSVFVGYALHDLKLIELVCIHIYVELSKDIYSGENNSHWICEFISIIKTVWAYMQVLEGEWVGIRCQESENRCVFEAGAITDKVVLWGVTYPVSQRIRYARYRLSHNLRESVSVCTAYLFWLLRYIRQLQLYSG